VTKTRENGSRVFWLVRVCSSDPRPSTKAWNEIVFKTVHIPKSIILTTKNPSHEKKMVFSTNFLVPIQTSTEKPYLTLDSNPEPLNEHSVVITTAPSYSWNEPILKESTSISVVVVNFGAMDVIGWKYLPFTWISIIFSM
jgi:hypothetical protein